MATIRNLLRSLETLERSPQFQLQIVRAQSSWVTPSSRRSRHYSCAPQPQFSTNNRRPVVNGKSVAFHINDIKSNIAQSSCATSLQLAAQRRLPHKANLITPIREYESDLIVVLDMDECLIHSQFLRGPGAKYAHQVRRANGAAKGESSVDTFNVTLPDGELVRVHERPHLHDFLRQVSTKFETHIFTAAMEVYAKPVLRMLDPHGDIFTHCWYRESCQFDSQVGAYVKNLGTCWDEERIKRTVLVDNNPLSFLVNPENGILVSSFYDDHNDTTLPAVMDLLQELDRHDDVRPLLDERFRLRQALNELSRGRPFAGRKQQIDEQRPLDEEHAVHHLQLVAAAAS
jgi:Dullard-like phosphatase family protein